MKRTLPKAERLSGWERVLPPTSAGRRELIDAILSDIGVPEEGVFEGGAVRESPAESLSFRHPVCHIVAGANGSGKSTFALHFLPRYADCLEFVNPDLIACGLSPFDPTRSAVRAGRLVLERIKELSHAKRDFGFETTLSGKSYLVWMKDLKRAGYRLHLYYLWAPGCDLLLPRISQRVATGGHFVPDEDVRRRYLRSLRHVREYAPLMDKIRLFDNSGLSPVLVYEKNGEGMIHDDERFSEINKGVGL